MFIKQLLNKNLFYSLLCAFIQQIIVAFSTFALAKVVSSSSSYNGILMWLIVFIASLFLVYIPSSLGLYFNELSKFPLLNKVTDIYIKNFYGRSSISRSKNLESEKTSYIANESFLISNQTYDFIWHFSGILLNVIFNILVLSILTSFRLGVAYILSFIIIVLISLRVNKKIESLNLDAQKARSCLTSCFINSWDNIALGNQYNFSIWKKTLLSAIVDTKKKVSTCTGQIEIISSLGSFFAIVPVLLEILINIEKTFEKNDKTLLMIIIATLPRQIMTMQNLSNLIQMFFHWSAIKTKLTGLINSLQLPLTISDHQGVIDLNKIKIKHETSIVEKIDNIQSIIDLCEKHNNIQIWGENGSGKTSLAVILKEHIGDDALYLPIKNNLEFIFSRIRHYSSGEAAIKSLEEIISQARPKYLILDEIDATLDNQNLVNFYRLIIEYSKNNKVIWVSHRSNINEFILKYE